MMDLTLNSHTLDDVIRKKNVSFKIRLLILVNLLQPLRILKPQGIVHMDMSLSNILVTENYSVKLIDFG